MLTVDVMSLLRHVALNKKQTNRAFCDYTLILVLQRLQRSRFLKVDILLFPLFHTLKNKVLLNMNTFLPAVQLHICRS